MSVINVAFTLYTVSEFFINTLSSIFKKIKLKPWFDWMYNNITVENFIQESKNKGTDLTHRTFFGKYFSF